MIARIWRGTATIVNADAYHRHFMTKVAPHLKDIPGHRGASLLRCEAGDRVEFLAVTFWESIEAIRKFAGQNPDAAIVEPEARAVLAEFDDFARHYEVAYSSTSNA